ncbi:MAG: hypothetical protein EXX96DRAFT_613523 [Benjaminiella poitrasii]|nr:MAG: hypothetical protein EXX96DRAFT_613523 [Benjaminiella poitrasii]
MLESMYAMEYPGLLSAWQRLLAIIQDLPDPAIVIAVTSDPTETYPSKEVKTLTTTSSNNDKKQRMTNAMQNIFTITSQDEGYVAFILTMVSELRHDCPTSISFMKHIIEYSQVPSMETVERLVPRLLPSAAPHEQQVNQMILLSVLAQRWAGRLAELMWTLEVGPVLWTRLRTGDWTLRLHALLALESFALTGAVKKRMMEEIDVDAMMVGLLGSFDRWRSLSYGHALKRWWSRCRSKWTLNQKRQLGALNRSVNVCDGTRYADSESIVNFQDVAALKQFHHCLNWLAKRVFNCKGLPHLELSKSQLQSVYLVPVSYSRCKFDEGRLGVRNDTIFLESVRTNTSIARHGRWYYEVLLLTNGTMQIGWGGSDCLLSPERGYGVGDDRNGFAFDTYRSVIWWNGQIIKMNNQNRYMQCKPGYVIGSLLDMDTKLCTFYVNGQDCDLTVKFSSLKEDTAAILERGGIVELFPTISLASYQHAVFNFGDCPWQYTPSVRNFKGVCKVDSKSIIMNKASLVDQAQLSLLYNSKEEDEFDASLCSICYLEPNGFILLPCKHDGFGVKCANKLTKCPFCRAEIKQREYTK